MKTSQSFVTESMRAVCVIYVMMSVNECCERVMVSELEESQLMHCLHWNLDDCVSSVREMCFLMLRKISVSRDQET